MREAPPNPFGSSANGSQGQGGSERYAGEVIAKEPAMISTTTRLRAGIVLRWGPFG